MGGTYKLHTPLAISTALRRGMTTVEHPYRSGPFFLLLPMNVQPLLLNGFNIEELPRVPKAVPADHFRIVVGRNAYITQSASTNNTLLWELEHENRLWIHPASAQRLGIRQGDTVAVESPAGRGRLKARLTDRTRPDTVYMDTGYGVISKGLSKIFGKGACIAEVLEDYADDISGNMAMHETIVRVRKV